MIERKDIYELVARYELEPTLKDLYVEGPRDQGLFEWLAEGVGIENVVAYGIDSVDVPEELILKHSLANNHRGRVIALALELKNRSTVDLRDRVACIADADFARIVEESHDTELLIWTDFTAAELYLFDVRVLDKYVRLAAIRREIDAARLLEEAAPILRELFLVRVAANQMNINLGLVEFDGCCRIKERAFVFNRDEYVRRYIQRGEHARRRDEFLRVIEVWRKRLDVDPRHSVHGHDFANVLHWLLRRVYRVNALPPVEHFATTLWAALEVSYLEGTGLAAELRRRFSRPA